MRANSRKIAAVLAGLAAFVFGAVTNFHYGRRGFENTDSPVFDGGWRVFDGQVPFQDFVATFSIVPDVIQAGFFWLFGVTYTAYLLHASVVNGLFGILSLCLIRRMGGPLWLALLYALLATIAFYPPRGVPFMDTHSFFFGFVATYLAVIASASTGRRTAALTYLAAFLCLWLSFFSKPSPAVFFIPLVGMWLVLEERRWAIVATTALLSTALVAAALIGVVASGPMTLADALFYTFLLPAKIGGDRLTSIMGLLRQALFTPRSLKVATPVLYLVLAFGIGTLAVAFRGYPLRLQPDWRTFVRPAFLAVGLNAVPMIFTPLSANPIDSNTQFLFLSLGLIHVAVVRALKLDGHAARVMAIGLGLFAFERADHFRAVIVAKRLTYEAWVDPHLVPRTVAYPGLDSLQWLQKDCTADVAAAQLTTLAALPGNFVGGTCLGDARWGIAYGLTGKVSPLPVVGYGPMPGSLLYDRYADFQRAALGRHDVRYVVVSANGIRDRGLEALLAGTAICGRQTVAEARLEIAEICPGAWK